MMYSVPMISGYGNSAKQILNTIFKVHFAVRKDIAYIKQAKFKLCEIENKLLLPGSGI